MMIGMGLFWLATILGVVWLAHNSREQRQPEAPSDNALTILDRRFAEGALSIDEYKQRRGAPPPPDTPHPRQAAKGASDETPHTGNSRGGQRGLRAAPPRSKSSRHARPLPRDDDGRGEQDRDGHVEERLRSDQPLEHSRTTRLVRRQKARPEPEGAPLTLRVYDRTRSRPPIRPRASATRGPRRRTPALRSVG